jgi:hypothetical protein
MKLRQRGVAMVLVLVAVGCIPKYKGDVDRVLAAHAGPAPQVAAPTALEPQPWRVGQWALYKTSQGGDVGYEKDSVVAQTACGIWIERLVQSYEHRSLWKSCWASDPSAGTRAIDRIQVVVMQVDDRHPIVVDFRDGKNAQLRHTLDGVLMRLLWKVDANLPREDVDVPAGHFAQTARSTTTVSMGAKSFDFTAWVHPEVPLGGLVKGRASDGTDALLLAYGQDGATSVLPNEPLRP